MAKEAARIRLEVLSTLFGDFSIINFNDKNWAS
jgi:hypothetical protein